MIKHITYLLAVLITLSVSSCYTQSRHSYGHLPPGKAKKIYGEKSAKKHAPGQKNTKSSKHPHKYDIYYTPNNRF